jgi:hypothetical protein
MINKIKGLFKKPKPETTSVQEPVREIEPAKVTKRVRGPKPIKRTKTTLQIARDVVEYMNGNSSGKYTASEMETLALEIATQIEFRSNRAMEIVMALLNNHDLKGYELAKEMIDRMDQQKI